MKKIIVGFLFMIFVAGAKAQLPNYWDVPVTEILIEHNKNNFSDNTDAKNNQLASTATTKTWTKAKSDMKNMVDKIDKRLTQAFIVTADITVLYEGYSYVDDIADLQKKSLQIANKYPWSIPLVINKEVDIYNEAVQTVEYIFLIVSSYGDINKMQVSSRKKIFTQIKLELWALKAKCLSLYNYLQRLDLAQTLKNTAPVKLVNKDKEIVKDIMDNFKKY